MVEDPGWQEQDSREFIEQGDAFVPHRQVQLRVICDLLPTAVEPFVVVDLACGAGALSAAILDRYPRAQVHAVDGSPEMLGAARKATARWADRISFAGQQLERWTPDPAGRPLAVVTSLALHHLEDDEKQSLLRRVRSTLLPGGALLIADLVSPQSRGGKQLAADMWEEAVASNSRRAHGDERGVASFRRLGWNMYALDEPDAEDRPASVLDQLLWLQQAGFVDVDVFWMWAGHAIFGGSVPAAIEAT